MLDIPRPGRQMSPGRWGLLVAVTVLAVFALSTAMTVNGGLRWDDFGNLRFYRETDVLTYLFTPVFDHFAPGHRLLTMLHHVFGPRNTGAMHLVMGAIQAVAMGGFMSAASRLYGRRTWLAVLTIVVSLSTSFIAVQLWFAAALHQVPALAAGLWSLDRFLRYRTTGHSRDLAASVLLVIVGLAFVSKVLLFVGVIYLLDQLVLRPTRLASVPARTIAEWPVWLAYGLPALVYLVVASGRLVLSHEPSSADSIVVGIRDAWLHRLAPSLVGWDPSSVSLTSGEAWALAMGVQVLIAVVIYLAALRRRDSIRVAMVVLAVALVDGVMTLLLRIDTYGPSVPLTYRYWLEPIVVAGLLLPWGFVKPADAGAPRILREPPHWLGARATGTLALAALVATSAWSARELVDGHSAYAAKAWLDDVTAAIESEPKPQLVDDLAPIAWSPVWTLFEMSYLWPEATFTGSEDALLVAGDELVDPAYEPFFDLDGASLAANTLTKIDGEVAADGRALCTDDGATVEMVLAPSEIRRFGQMAFHGDGTVLFVPVDEMGAPQPGRTLHEPGDERSDVLFPMDRWPLASFRLHLLPTSADPVCLERVSVGVVSNAPPIPEHEGP